MALVFRGHDRDLDRPVAIKLLRPELATAAGAARFLREARTLARLGHPNVVPIHEVGEREGLYYYVMDFLEGDSLARRLEAGPLPPAEAASVGIDLLRALRAAHSRGILHRDVKPGNVFLTEDRAVLGDFGIALGPEAGEEQLTVTGQRLGTPAYMAPEQAAGEEATPRTDVHGAGMVLYETFTGRRWSTVHGTDDADWSGVPKAADPVIRRALARAPAERWPDAAAFLQALSEAVEADAVLRPATTRGRRTGGRGTRTAASLGRGSPLIRRAAAVAALVVAAAGVYLAIRFLPPGGEAGGARTAGLGTGPADLALLPCETSVRADTVLGERLARIAGFGLEGLPGLRVVATGEAFRWWSAAGGPEGGADAEDAAPALDARRAVRCRLLRSSTDSVELRVELVDADGHVAHHAVLRGAADSEVALGNALALDLLRSLRPREDLAYTVLARHDLEAVRAFLRGEAAFQRDARSEAEGHYTQAVAIDSGFALAIWRLADLRRWLQKPPGVDLDRLHAERAGELPPLDRRLLEARVTPPGPERWSRYDSILRDFPRDAYATLVFGDDLKHRGALWGIGLDSALAVLERATRLDSLLAPAHEHLAWIEIRLGRRAEARATLDRLAGIAAPLSQGDVYYPALLEQAFLEAFEPERAAAGRLALFGPPGRGRLEWLMLAARWGLWFGVPETELALGERLVRESGLAGAAVGAGRVAERNGAGAGRSPTGRGDPLGDEGAVRAATTGYVARALALWALGRPSAAIANFDSAAALTGDPALAIQAAEWRVLPSVLGIAGVPAEEESVQGRAALEWAASDPALPDVLRARAEWALRVADTPGRASGSAAEWPLPYDEAGRTLRPFGRAAAHLLRGERLAAERRPASADSALIWYQNVDIEGLPLGPAQAGEVDWALATEARLRRARIARDAGSLRDACGFAEEVLAAWSAAEDALRSRIEEARALHRQTCAP